MTSEAYLETCKHLRQSFSWEQFTAKAVNWSHKKTPSQKFVDSNYVPVLRQFNNFNGTDCSWMFRVGLSCLICSASGSFLLNLLSFLSFEKISKWSMFTFSWPVVSLLHIITIFVSICLCLPLFLLPCSDL